jgi:hypothetical protein
MAQRGRPKKKTEYVNTTTYPIWVEKLNLKRDGIVAFEVKPGKSVHFDLEEEEMNQTNSPVYFLQGQLRAADAKLDALKSLKVRNEMSHLEIVKYVEITEEVEKFTEDLQQLTSLNTLELFETEVKKSNKTIDFYFVIQDRKAEVDTEKKTVAGFFPDEQ